VAGTTGARIIRIRHSGSTITRMTEALPASCTYEPWSFSLGLKEPEREASRSRPSIF
jgi:hypothetical protein